MAERKEILRDSPMANLYNERIDRESAAEILAERAEDRLREEELQREREVREKELERLRKNRTAYEDDYRDDRRRTTTRSKSSRRQTPSEAAINTFARTMARQLGNQLVRGILGSLKRGR